LVRAVGIVKAKGAGTAMLFLAENLAPKDIAPHHNAIGRKQVKFNFGIVAL